MIKFELDVKRSTIIVHGDNTNVNNEFTTYADATDFCIDYLKRFIYNSVNQLINARKQEFAHAVYTHQVDDVCLCEHLQKRNQLVYLSDNWFTAYLNFVNLELRRIEPSVNSRFHNGFVSKRKDLAETIEYYSSCKSIYYKTNVAVQQRMEFV